MLMEYLTCTFTNGDERVFYVTNLPEAMATVNESGRGDTVARWTAGHLASDGETIVETVYHWHERHVTHESVRAMRLLAEAGLL